MNVLVGLMASCTGMWFASLVGLTKYSIGWFLVWGLVTILCIVAVHKKYETK